MLPPPPTKARALEPQKATHHLPEQTVLHLREHNTELPASPPNVQLQTVTLLNG